MLTVQLCSKSQLGGTLLIMIKYSDRELSRISFIYAISRCSSPLNPRLTTQQSVFFFFHFCLVFVIISHLSLILLWMLACLKAVMV